MTRTLLAIGAIVAFVAGTARGAEEKVRLELRRAEDQAAEGLTEAKVPGTEQTIYLHAKADLTNDDIAEAQVGISNGRPAIDMTFTEEGAGKMARMTTEHLKKRLAMLVDGKVVCAPIIQAQIRKKAQITGNFTKGEAERIARGLTGKAAG